MVEINTTPVVPFKGGAVPGDTLTKSEAFQKAEDTGLTNPELKNGKWIAMDPEFKPWMMGANAETDTGDDIVSNVMNSQAVQPYDFETYDLIAKTGMDPAFAAEHNKEVVLGQPVPEKAKTMTEEEFLKNELVALSAKILMPLFAGKNPAGDGASVDPTQGIPSIDALQRDAAVAELPKAPVEMTDAQAAQWGLEMMGWFNYHMPSMAMNASRLQAGDNRQKMAMYYLMEMYEEKGMTWDGVSRAFKGIISDPSTYVGLSTLGIGTMAGASLKAATKTSVKAAIRAALKPILAGAAEAGAYTLADDALRQAVKIMAGAQEGYDPVQGAISTGVGATFGAGFTGVAAAAVPAVKKALAGADQMVKDAMDGKLGMGVGPSDAAGVVKPPETVVNPDGTFRLYHGTTPESAAAIRAEGVMRGKEDGVFYTNDPEAAKEFGDEVVAVDVDPKKLELDDEFPSGRLDYRMPTKKIGDDVKVQFPPTDHAKGAKFVRKAANRPTERELYAINRVSSSPEEAQVAIDRVSEIRSKISIGESKEKFKDFEVTGGEFDEDGKFNPKVKQISYGYEVVPAGSTKKKWQTKLSNKMVTGVEKILARAKSGDQKAIGILQEARWYRDMRVRLRSEFGGLGDIFADLLGTTSAKTGVKDNFKNSVEVLRRFTKGEYAAEIAAWEARVAAGDTMNPVTLQQLHKAGQFPLITNAAGVLFNSNSPASMKALFGTFRDIKAKVSPKTPNFTGNLIGYSRDATIDVWAGRFLRNIAGLPYIPPVAEKAVGGKHAAGSTFDNPKITGEFGFGQDVFEQAANKLNKDGSVQAYDPSVGQIGSDDLQAIVWFMEKEKWTANGWTNKAGEGGSLDFEASIAGMSDPARREMLRTEAFKNFKAPNQRKTETDEQYTTRLNNAMSEHVARTANAESTLAEEAAPLDRLVTGVSAERPGQVPSNQTQAAMAGDLADSLAGNDQVVAHKFTNTYGNFAGVNERSLDGEIIVREGFNDTDLVNQLVKTGIEKDQDSVFLSKVIQNPTPEQQATANPGMELYFTKRKKAAFAQVLSDRLRERGIDGFTFVTDARRADDINVQAGGNEATSGITGLRIQYIPEFLNPKDPATMTREAAEDIYYDLVEEFSQEGFISSANVVHYDTKVFRRDTDTDWMSGGITYGEHTSSAGNPGSATGTPDRTPGKR